MDEKHLARMIFRCVDKFGGRTAMKYRTDEMWISVTWNSMGERIKACAKALVESGIQEGDRIGIFADNCPEWAIADFSIMSVGAISVPIAAVESAAEAERIVNHAGIKLLFTGDAAQYEKALSFYYASDYLQKIVIFSKNAAADDNPHALYFQDFIEMGRRSRRDDAVHARMEHVSTDDFATLIYTPGTGGESKGIILTHANLFHQIDSLQRLHPVREDDVSFCYLPLTRALERTWSYYIFYQGATNCYCPDRRRVYECLPQVQPTCMAVTPSFFEKLYPALNEKIKGSPAPLRGILEWARTTGVIAAKILKDGMRFKLGIKIRMRLSHMALKKLVRQSLGENMRYFICGGDFLPAVVEEFFLAAGVPVYQGYGLKEASPMVTINCPEDYMPGTAGKPLPECDVRIADDGEILVGGPNVMKGYYRTSGRSAEAFGEGWIRTGDIGELDNGYLRVLGRKMT